VKILYQCESCQNSYENSNAISWCLVCHIELCDKCKTKKVCWNFCKKCGKENTREELDKIFHQESDQF
jgi:hypothetical protein